MDWFGLAEEMPKGRGEDTKAQKHSAHYECLLHSSGGNSLVRCILEVEQDRMPWTNTAGLLQRTLQQISIIENNASMGQLACQSAESRSVKQDDPFLPSNVQVCMYE